MNYKAIILSAVALLANIILQAQAQKEIQLESFNEVKFEGSAQWVLVPSDVEKVVISSEREDVFDYIDIERQGGALVINTTDKNKQITKLFQSVMIKVYFKSIRSVSLSGVGSVTTNGKISADELTATLRGTGNMYLDIQSTEFMGNMYGTGMLNVKGTTDKSWVKVEGVGSFEGYELQAIDMNVTVSGVGGAQVYAAENLNATINGVGSVKYKGDPVNKNLNKNGLGSIKEAKD